MALKTIGCDGKDDGNLHKHLVISMRKLLLPICIVLAVAALVHVRRAQRKKCYEAQWVFASSYASIGILTNGVGEVVQPTGDELEAKTGYSRYNLLNITPTMIDGMQGELYSEHRRKLLFAQFVAEHGSVLDINDYNNNFLNFDGMWDLEDHAASPGKRWETKGPSVLLGYNYYAPQDSTHAPERIVRSWVNFRRTTNDVDAWMQANDNMNGRNACVIVKDAKYVYFKRTRHKFFSQRFSTYEKVEVRKENW